MKFFGRFFGWWAGISSLVAMGGTCPCCGNGICPQGLALFGVIGAVLACVLRIKTPASTVPEDEAPQFAQHGIMFESHDSFSMRERVSAR